MANAAVAEKAKDAAESRKVPAIKTSSMEQNRADNRNSSWWVRLPQGVIWQDLHDYPEDLWRAVQSSPNTSLRKFDDVRLIEFDEEWFIDTTVSYADSRSVRFTDLKDRQFCKSHQGEEWEDETYRVKWAGNGFACYRKKDNQVMLGGETYSTLAVAKDAVFKQLYPTKRVAA